MQVNGLRRHHQATVAEVARVLNSRTDQQRKDLGTKDWKPTQAHEPPHASFSTC